MKNKLLIFFLLALVVLTYYWKKSDTALSLRPLAKLTHQEISALNLPNSHNTELQDLFFLFDSMKMANHKYDWLNWNTKPIAIDLPLKLLIKFNSQNKDSTLTMSGKLPQKSEEWWQSLTRIYLSYNNEGTRLVLRMRDGKSLDQVFYKEVGPAYPNQTLLLEFMNNGKRTMQIKTLSGKVLYKLDLAREKKLKLPLGMFPENMLYIGVNLPKGGHITVQKLILAN